MKISIILPARNEELLIVSVLGDITKYLKKKRIISYEILVVVNGSQDKTEKLVKDFQRSSRNIKILKSKAGYGFALRMGLKIAKGRYVIIYNVDFFDLKMLDLVEIDLFGKDFIIGSKMTYWSKDYRLLHRRIISFLFNLYLKVFFGFRGSDTHGIKIIKRKVLDKVLNKCKTTSGIFDTELVLRAQKEGFGILDFPVVLTEKRLPRFVDRIWQTPIDIINLYKTLKK